MDILSRKEEFKGRDFLSLYDYTPDEINYLLDVAASLKELQQRGEPHPLLAGKTLGMIFQKSSTRTRVSFEVGMYQLGGYPLFLSSSDLQLGRGETIADTGRVLARYLDGIMIRTYAHEDVQELAAHAGIPIINGLTDLLHPCQALADLLTIKEKKGWLAGLKLAYVGDGNNVAHSLMLGGAKVGMHVVVATPPGYAPKEEITLRAREAAAGTGATVTVTSDPVEAVTAADVVYTDVWASMGQETEKAERAKIFAPYQVNAGLVKAARSDFIFLHCLPAYRNLEVTSDVIDGPNSVVFEEAENRLHVQKAIMALLI
ncbi:ornithine carbamoyltransferase [Clostridiales bacterium PH28_bin88]|nr:ornithine carbamoyltransferase [Clostridiales bacterium PH28_bin88]